MMQWEQRPGETIYKGHRSYDLMLNLQLGIRWSVSRNARDPAMKEIPSSVFSEKVTQWLYASIASACLHRWMLSGSRRS